MAVVLVISIIARLAGNAIAPQSSIVGAIVAPFQKMVTSISNGIKDFTKKTADNSALILENAELVEQINSLNNSIADYEEIKAENEFYKDYLEIKDAHPDYTFCDATVISRDATDEFGGFTIDAGSLSGIKVFDPVITNAGLVGYVSEVGLTTSKVTTLLSSGISIGAVDSRTGDAGVVGGTLDFAANGTTRMYNIQRSSSVAIGDYIVTSGSGIFPSFIRWALVTILLPFACLNISQSLTASKQPLLITSLKTSPAPTGASWSASPIIMSLAPGRMALSRLQNKNKSTMDASSIITAS